MFMSDPNPSKLPHNRGKMILNMLFSRESDPDRLARGDEPPGSIDTYKSLKQLREMLKGGQITELEYEEIKLELLTR